MRITEQRITIPQDYVWMVKGSSSPGKLFKRYVEGYVRNNYPGWQLVRIEKMKALIERK